MTTDWTKPSLSLTAGKTYKDREGNTYKVDYVRGHFFDPKTKKTWYASGSYDSSFKSRHVHDLIEEVAEPFSKVEKVWINLYPDSMYNHSTELEAQRNAHHKALRKAVPVTVTYTEGH